MAPSPPADSSSGAIGEREANTALGAPRDELAAIVASCSEAIVSVGRAGLISTWNPAAERLYGYTAAEAIGRPVDLIIPPELRDELYLLQSGSAEAGGRSATRRCACTRMAAASRSRSALPRYTTLRVPSWA